MVAIYLVGCMIGALSCISLGDKLGRKKVTVVGGTVAIIGCIMHACAFSLGLLIAGRIVLGLGFGALSSTVPIWQAECCPARHRGALMALQGAFVCVGLTVSQWLTFGLFFTSGSVTWRVPVAFPIVPLVLLLAFIPFLPDSPRWLVKVGRFEEARHIMGIFEDAPDDSTQVQENLHKIQRSLEIMGAAKFTDILSNKENKLLHRTLIAMFSASAQQISGTGVIGAYTAIIFEEYVGLSAIDARIVSACLFMWQILVSFVSCYAIDRVGRRALLMFGITGMGVTLAIIGGTTSNPTNKACSVVAAVSVFLFTAFLGVGVLGVSYMYGAEVAPLSHRVPIYAMTSLVLWSCNFLIVEGVLPSYVLYDLPRLRTLTMALVTPVALAHMAWRFFFIWAGVNLCLILPSERYSIETSRCYMLIMKCTSHLLLTARDP